MSRDNRSKTLGQLEGETERSRPLRFSLSPCLRTCLSLFCIWLAVGCSLFDPPAVTQTTAKKIPQLRPAPGSIQLDAVYVERPIGDSLLGDELWRYVDQVAAVDAEARGPLRKNGFRVGLVGANPPLALQKMLGLKSDFASEPEAEQAKRLTGRRFFLVSGTDTEIQVSPTYPSCAIRVDRAGQSVPMQFEQAVCKFRIRAERMQDGWARLEFVPQVYHGTPHDRRVVGSAGWQFQIGQESETFLVQRFNVKLCTGEMAIVTGEDGAAGTLGHLFFRGPAALRPPSAEEEGSSAAESSAAEPPLECPVQRLLIVRLAGMDTSSPR